MQDKYRGFRRDTTHILLSGLSWRCMVMENPNMLPASPSFLMTWLVSRLKASTKVGSRTKAFRKSAAKASGALPSGSGGISALSRCFPVQSQEPLAAGERLSTSARCRDWLDGAAAKCLSPLGTAAPPPAITTNYTADHTSVQYCVPAVFNIILWIQMFSVYIGVGIVISYLMSTPLWSNYDV